MGRLMVLRQEFRCDRRLLKKLEVADRVLLKKAGKVDTQAMMMAMLISGILGLLGVSLQTTRRIANQKEHSKDLAKRVVRT